MDPHSVLLKQRQWLCCCDWLERGTTWAKFWRRSEPEPDGSGAELTSEVKGHVYSLVHFREWPERSQGADCVFV